jgi:hypothetical protein
MEKKIWKPCPELGVGEFHTLGLTLNLSPTDGIEPVPNRRNGSGAREWLGSPKTKCFFDLLEGAFKWGQVKCQSRKTRGFPRGAHRICPQITDPNKQYRTVSNGRMDGERAGHLRWLVDPSTSCSIVRFVGWSRNKSQVDGSMSDRWVD